MPHTVVIEWPEDLSKVTISYVVTRYLDAVYEDGHLVFAATPNDLRRCIMGHRVARILLMRAFCNLPFRSPKLHREEFDRVAAKDGGLVDYWKDPDDPTYRTIVTLKGDPAQVLIERQLRRVKRDLMRCEQLERQLEQQLEACRTAREGKVLVAA